MKKKTMIMLSFWVLIFQFLFFCLGYKSGQELARKECPQYSAWVSMDQDGRMHIRNFRLVVDDDGNDTILTLRNTIRGKTFKDVDLKKN